MRLKLTEFAKRQRDRLFCRDVILWRGHGHDQAAQLAGR